MVADRLYLDPDLTLARIARRLHVPVKQLSAAVNRSRGENVSRLINGFRIRHACERLVADESVTAAVFNSGFNTKSNFNREFLRVTGGTPSEFVRGHAGAE
jgi:AraC-like DNA-binding protein